MKKLLIAAFALTLLSANAYATGGKKKSKSKKAKAQTECCSKPCPKDKVCDKTTTCPIIPGVCN